MTEALQIIDHFIRYTRAHGSKRKISIHNLFLLQDFAHGDLEYCKKDHAKIISILDKMDQKSPNVIIVRKFLAL